jgi:ribosomal protein S4E
MNTAPELHNKWLGGELVSGVNFLMNDYVVVASGKHAGLSGSVVSIIKFEPNPLYTLETETNGDIEVRESEIQYP